MEIELGRQQQTANLGGAVLELLFCLLLEDPSKTLAEGR
jgi:hypothetical protein